MAQARKRHLREVADVAAAKQLIFMHVFLPVDHHGGVRAGCRPGCGQKRIGEPTWNHRSNIGAWPGYAFRVDRAPDTYSYSGIALRAEGRIYALPATGIRGLLRVNDET